MLVTSSVPVPLLVTVSGSCLLELICHSPKASGLVTVTEGLTPLPVSVTLTLSLPTALVVSVSVALAPV